MNLRYVLYLSSSKITLTDSSEIPISAKRYVHFVGRCKRVIIISGYNVYPGDIEKLMTELDFINECCAVQGYLDGKPIVRLFVIKKANTDEEEAKEKIISLCSERLSKYNIPKEIRFIDALPRTRLEKVDFMALTEKCPEK